MPGMTNNHPNLAIVSKGYSPYNINLALHILLLELVKP